MKPILKRQWALRGQRPVITQLRRYQWMYTYIFVEPKTGASDFLILPSVSIEWMEKALEEFVREVDPCGRKTIVLVVDQAGWHMSKKLNVPNNLLIVPQPAYTPELSPIEPVVRKLKIPLANKLLLAIEKVEELIAEECLRLKANPMEMKRQTLFPWIRHVLESL